MNQLRLFFVCGLVALNLGTLSCNSSRTPDKQEEQRSLYKANREKIGRALASQHNAVTDWERSFPNRITLYTVEAEDALVRADGRPVLFYREVEDVSRSGNGYLIRFSRNYEDIQFILEATPEQAQAVLRQKKDEPEYAVVANITSVRKAEIKIEADDADISLDDGEIITARGRCIALVPVPSQPVAAIPREKEKEPLKATWALLIQLAIIALLVLVLIRRK